MTGVVYQATEIAVILTVIAVYHMPTIRANPGRRISQMATRVVN